MPRSRFRLPRLVPKRRSPRAGSRDRRDPDLPACRRPFDCRLTSRRPGSKRSGKSPGRRAHSGNPRDPALRPPVRPVRPALTMTGRRRILVRSFTEIDRDAASDEGFGPCRTVYAGTDERERTAQGWHVGDLRRPSAAQRHECGGSHCAETIAPAGRVRSRCSLPIPSVAS